MNSGSKTLLWTTESRFRFPLLLAFGLLALGCGRLLIADEPHTAPDLTVHEWGTFTAIAGRDGKGMVWQTLRDSTDLPEFVEHFSDVNFKTGLRGTIRMETPVLYFYAPRDVRVSVRVAFSKGVITEWYPHAARTEPVEPLRSTDLRLLRSEGSIVWRGVTISPDLSGEFPRDFRPNRYYAARDTSSTPLSVTTEAGLEQEKFLFYRGVSAAPLPLSAAQSASGDLEIRSLDRSTIPAMILFQRSGDGVGYRFVRAPTDEAVLQSPELTGNLELLRADLENVLVDQGLYPDEAHAMVETWWDSWFEEGSRVIYIVPQRFIDSVLPLTIDPAPARLVRVFVGRLEIVTPATAEAVHLALASHDQATLNKYGRFLEAILKVARTEPSAPLQETGGHR